VSRGSDGQFETVSDVPAQTVREPRTAGHRVHTAGQKYVTGEATSHHQRSDPQVQVLGGRSGPMEQVVHDGRETAYRVVRPGADGPTALYVHGSGADHRSWVHQYAPGGPFHPAAALDLSGHGDSDDIDTGAGPGALAAYAADVAAVARAVDADVLVGNSLGGAVLFETLLSGLYDPDGAVFAGTGAKLAVHESIRTMLREDFDGVVEALHGDSRLLYDADESVGEQSRAALLAAGQRVTRRDFMTCHTFDVRDRLDDLDLPALAVVGEHDSLTPPAYHEYLADELPDCELAVVEDAAHLAMLEQPEAFNTAVETLAGRL
jgi:3-oxoadipate enol-lactonase